MTEEEKKIVNETKQLIEDIVILSGGVRDFTYGNMNIRISTVDTLIKILEKLQKESEELKNKVVKRDKELIRLEEYANKNFERKDDVKANYIPKDKIREKIRYLGDEGYYEFNTERDLEKAIEMFKELLEEE